MIVRRLVFAVTVVVSGVALVAVVSAAAAPHDDGQRGASLIAAARDAVTRYTFTGVVAVEWYVGTRKRVETVPVRDDDGVLLLGSSTRVMGEGSERLVRESDGWAGLWADSATTTQPAPGDHYDLSVRAGGSVAGRSTTLVEAVPAHGDAVQERLYFDTSTGIMLRREQLDNGRIRRVVGFVEITKPERAGTTPPTPPRLEHESKPLSMASVERRWDAPRTLADGFALVDAYRRPDGSVQLFYSDGLLSLSVFEQKGPLDHEALPHGGRNVDVGSHRVRVYETAGGGTAVWESGNVVYSCVTDVPVSRLGALLAKLPAHHGPSSLSKVVHFVLGPFSWS